MSLYVYVADELLRMDMRDHLQSRRWTDSGFDLLSPYNVLNFEQLYLGRTVNTGVVVAALQENGLPAPCMLIPRSSLSATPLRLSNSIGLIDMGYRGEVLAKVDCVDETVQNYEIEHGKRLFQIVQHNWLPWQNIIIVDSLNYLPAAPDNRGAGGFGSTGT